MKEPLAAPSPTPDLLSELRVSGHLMLLDPGLFCVVQTPSLGADPATGLPGVRLSSAPGAAGLSQAVQISGFAPDGWLKGTGDAALVRVSGGPAQVLVTIYQARDAQDGTAPNLQVTRLLDADGVGSMRPGEATPASAPTRAAARPPALPIGAAAPRPTEPRVMEMVGHFQSRGDIGAMLGEWLGARGSKLWIEGFAVAPTGRIAAADIEYQAVLGPGWLSPWVEGGQFCGSRGMALPLLGLRVRLRAAAAEAFDVQYAATFVDGTEIGPVGEGEPCEAANLVALESFRIDLLPRAAAAEPMEDHEADAELDAETPLRGRRTSAAPAPRTPARIAAKAAPPVKSAAKGLTIGKAGKPAPARSTGRGGWPAPPAARGKTSKR